MPNVYLDYAAAAPLDQRALEAMLPFLSEHYGNPSSFHTTGKFAKDALEEARGRLAGLLGARADEIIFTGSGTESDNLAVLGFARAHATASRHLVTTALEHQAVLEAVQHLEKKEGFSATYIQPDAQGLISAQQVLAVLRPDTVLVSVMAANNEIGTIEPIAEIGAAIQKWRGVKPLPAFHTDACQAAGYLALDVAKLHVDMLSLNGSKIYGPKGSGALYLKRGIKLTPLVFGGPQERALRPGTENIAGAVGLARALELVQSGREEEAARLRQLRDHLIKGILATIPKTRLNGHPEQRLPNNVNISFLDIEGEALLLYLDAAGIYASTGSACTSASLEPSHVILSLGLPYEVAHGSLRFTLGRSTTEEDIDYVLMTLPPLVAKLRSLSPVCVDEKYYASTNPQPR